MASTDVMRADVRVDAVFILSEINISTLKEKGDENEVHLGKKKWTWERNELTSGDREFHKNHLRMSNHTHYASINH
jgi:hypothetical protein